MTRENKPIYSKVGFTGIVNFAKSLGFETGATEYSFQMRGKDGFNFRHKKLNVTVYGPSTDYINGKDPASVSWASIGSVKATDAEAFAKAITNGAKIAKKLNSMKVTKLKK